MKDNQQERFPIVDEEGTVIGEATRGECHNGSHLLHPVVHLHVFNGQGDVYLQKRPEWKDIQKFLTKSDGSIPYSSLKYLENCLGDIPILHATCDMFSPLCSNS